MRRFYRKGVKLPLRSDAGPWPKRHLGDGSGLVKTAAKRNLSREPTMADDKVHPTATEMDYPAHFRNYGGFLALLKWGLILVAITTAVVLYTISN
jgi:hypothetical protein